MYIFKPNSIVKTCESERADVSLQLNKSAMVNAMPSLRCLVIEDSLDVQRELYRYLSHLPSILIIDSCATSNDALTFLQKKPVDALLLPLLTPLNIGVNLLKKLLCYLVKVPLLLLYSYECEYLDLNVSQDKFLFRHFLKTASITATRHGETIISTIHSSVMPDSIKYYRHIDKILPSVRFAELCYANTSAIGYVSIVMKQISAPSLSNHKSYT